MAAWKEGRPQRGTGATGDSKTEKSIRRQEACEPAGQGGVLGCCFVECGDRGKITALGRHRLFGCSSPLQRVNLSRVQRPKNR